MFKSYADVSPEQRTTVWNAGFSDYITPINMSQEQLDNRLESLGMSPVESKVYFSGDEPAGIYLYADATISGEKMSWLGGMSVDPQYRGQGIALKMLENFQTTSLENDVSSMYLEAIDGNDRAIDIYQSFGFQPFKQVSFLNSTAQYTGTSQYQLTKLKDLVELCVHEDINIPWQNKVHLGLDCFGISDDHDQFIGYVVVKQQGTALVINQLVLKKPSTQVIEVLELLTNRYQPTSWIGSNLETENDITDTLKTLGFKETVTQHQYVKKI